MGAGEITDNRDSDRVRREGDRGDAAGQVWRNRAGRIWRARAGGLPRAFWLLWAATLANRIGGFVQPFLVLYLTQVRGFGVATAGLVAALVGVGSLIAQPLGGIMADRAGRVPTMVAGFVAGAACLVALGVARAPHTIAALALLVGLAGDLYRPASAALVADLVPPPDRPRAYALQFWAINLGFTVATTLAGLLATRGYLLLFLLDAATMLVAAVLVGVGVRRLAGRAMPARPVGQDRRAQRGAATAVRDPLLIAISVLTFLLACIYAQSTATLPLAMSWSRARQ